MHENVKCFNLLSVKLSVISYLAIKLSAIISYCTFEEYVCSDNNLQYTTMLSSADIVATLGSVEGNDCDDAGDKLPFTYSQVCSAFETVKSLIHSHRNYTSEPPYELLDTLNMELIKCPKQVYTQTSITDYA